MKVAVSVLLIIIAIAGAFKLWDYWERVSQEKEEAAKVSDGSDILERDLPGMPWQLESAYGQARGKGAAGLKDFLEKYGKAPNFKDPRKAWVQLDYVVLIAGSDALEAKKVFLDVKGRVKTNAPIYRRIRAMSSAYE